MKAADLTKKRKIVLSDKAKIAEVIAELDEKKNVALKKAHDQVNKVSSGYWNWRKISRDTCGQILKHS